MSIFGITTTAGGMAIGFPDACKTPTPAGPVPIPYPNTAMMNQAATGSCTNKVKIVNKPALTSKSKVPISTGNEAGSAGGVASSKIKGEAQFTKTSTKVKLEGSPAAYHTCTMGQNGKPFNVPSGVHTVPSQTKVKTDS